MSCLTSPQEGGSRLNVRRPAFSEFFEDQLTPLFGVCIVGAASFAFVLSRLLSLK